MATEPSANPALIEYEKIILRTRELDREGLLDTPAAAELTQEWDALWEQMNGYEQELINGLSGDLYMIEDEEIYHPGKYAESTQAEVWQATQLAYQNHDWPRLLELLRTGMTGLSPQSVATLRGVAYEALGLRVASQQFIEFTKQIIAPENSDSRPGGFSPYNGNN